MVDAVAGIWGCQQLCDYFARERIAYERLDHPPVYTADEAERLVPRARGAHAKNLLVEDRKDGRLFMLTVPFSQRYRRRIFEKKSTPVPLAEAKSADPLDPAGAEASLVGVLDAAGKGMAHLTIEYPSRPLHVQHLGKSAKLIQVLTERHVYDALNRKRPLLPIEARSRA